MSGAATGDGVLLTAAGAATDLCYFAACFPPSLEVAQLIPRGVGAPFAIGEACGNWQAAAATIQQIQQSLAQMCSALPLDAWDGDDRTGFDSEVKNLLAELGDSHNTAEAIGITLEVLVPVFPLWVTSAAVIGAILAAEAAFFYASVASIVGDVTGEAELAYGEGVAAAEACLTVMVTSSQVLIGILAAATAAISAAVAVDIGVQSHHGDSAALGDLGQATVDGLGADAFNALQYGGSRLLDKKGEGATTEHSDPAGTTPSLMTRVMRGEEHSSNIGNRAKYQFIDGSKDAAVDMSHIPAGLQDLINGAAGRSGPEVENLESVADNATDDG